MRKNHCLQTSNDLSRTLVPQFIVNIMNFMRCSCLTCYHFHVCVFGIVRWIQ